MPRSFRCATETSPRTACTRSVISRKAGSVFSTNAGRPRPMYRSKASLTLAAPRGGRWRARRAAAHRAPARLEEHVVELEAHAEPRSRVTISRARRTRSARQRSRKASSAGDSSGRKYPSTCISPQGAAAENSQPPTTRRPSRSPAASRRGYSGHRYRGP